MKKTLLSIIGLFFCVIGNSQDVQDTYWKYRDRLRKEFVKIGALKGESIPAVVKRPGVGKNQTSYTSEEGAEGSIKFSDATITPPLAHEFFVCLRVNDSLTHQSRTPTTRIQFASHTYNYFPYLAYRIKTL